MKERPGPFPTVIFFIILNFCLWGLSSYAHDIIDYASVEQIVYAQHVQPLFNKNCLASGCHNSRDRANGLDLTPWESLIRGSDYGAVLISGHAEHSHLVEPLEGEVEPRMPLHRPPLQVAMAPADKFAYVACYVSAEVRVIDTAAKTVIATVRVGKSPFLLEVTPDGKFVYVANQQSNNMSVFVLPTIKS